MVLELRMGDVIRMRRKHPCGGFDWEVVRLGLDIGLRCRTCGRRVLMDRQTLRRRAKELVERGEPIDPEIARVLWGDEPPESAPPSGYGT
jgi:hypothetical protein